MSLDDVQKILEERQSAYGSATEMFDHVAVLWEDILGIEVLPSQVASCMIMLKVARLIADTDDDSHDADSVLDIKGYAKLRLEELR